MMSLRSSNALDLTQVDVLGWSMVGYVARSLALDHWARGRRLIAAGSGPGPVPGTPAGSARVPEVASRPVNDDEDLLLMLFQETPTARRIGAASLRRLDYRLQVSTVPLARIAGPAGIGAQNTAIGNWGRGVDTSWGRLGDLTLPTLVGCSAHDVMIHPFRSYFMSQRPPSAKIVLYNDDGHGFLLEHADHFSDEVLRFLA